jgi:prefoldin subunit 5
VGKPTRPPSLDEAARELDHLRRQLLYCQRSIERVNARLTAIERAAEAAVQPELNRLVNLNA